MLLDTVSIISRAACRRAASRRVALLRVGGALACLSLSAAAHAQVGPAFHVSVNTASLLPSTKTGYFLLSFNPSNLGNTLGATANVTQFTATLGSLIVNDPGNGPNGAVTGSLANTLTMMNTDLGGDNSLAQAINFGGIFGFNVAFSGPAFDKSLTTSPSMGTTDFLVTLEDATQMPLTSGLAADISIAPNAVVTPTPSNTPTNFPPYGQVGPVPAIMPPSVPESGSLTLLAGGLLVLSIARRRGVPRRRPG